MKHTGSKRVTMNLPADLLDDAMSATGGGITETVVEGLEQIRRRRAWERAKTLRGKLTLEIDLESSRERHRR
jgi:hypothetical protein